ncbi:MAG: NUDIX domain-containing protein [bacterium]
MTQAGAVVFRQSERGPLYLLVEASGGERWVLPKGGIERRESAEETAARELLEEAAVEARTVSALGPARLAKRGERVHVEFFLMEYVRSVTPHETRAVRWCPFEAACETLDDTKAVRVLKRAHEHVSATLPRPLRQPVYRAWLAWLGAAAAGLLALLVTALAARGG